MEPRYLTNTGLMYIFHNRKEGRGLFPIESLLAAELDGVEVQIQQDSGPWVRLKILKLE